MHSGAEGPGFKSQSRRCRVAVLGKLFTPIVPLFTSSKIGSSRLKGCGVTAGLADSNGSLPSRFMIRVTCSGTLRSVIEHGLPLPFFTKFCGWLGNQWLACWTQAQKGLGSNRSCVSLRQTVHPWCLGSPSTKLVAALLRVTGVNAGLTESNGSLPPDL